ncbi:MAG: hypothetical protein LC808_41965, partial [Actinobacteria bacterium]|nr:hypothetical protein [Actinomycetota bacterium]
MTNQTSHDGEAVRFDRMSGLDAEQLDAEGYKKVPILQSSSARLPQKQRPLQENVVNSYQQFITPRRDRCLLTVS